VRPRTGTEAPGRASLGQIVLYHCKEGDDTPELVPFPLTAGMDTFAAIVARVHAQGLVDLMVVDPSKGPMPRWNVPHASAARPGHWTEKIGTPGPAAEE
jgi:hypothetical protein